MTRLARCFLVCFALLVGVDRAAAQPAPPPAPVSPFAPPKDPFTDGTIFKPPPKDPPKDAPPPNVWSGGAEFGLNGSSGNSDLFKVRFGGNLKRCTDENVFTADLFYALADLNGVRSENKALFNSRDEMRFWKDSPWSVFVSSQLEYDQFRAYDFRVGGYSGISYQCVKTATTSWKCRLGAGLSREIGGQPDRWVPEALIGTTFEHRLTNQQRFLASVDAYPDLNTFGHVRVRSFAAYEIVLNPDWHLALRLGIQDRYDSQPGPAKPNDVDYFTTVLFKF